MALESDLEKGVTYRNPTTPVTYRCGYFEGGVLRPEFNIET